MPLHVLRPSWRFASALLSLMLIVGSVACNGDGSSGGYFIDSSGGTAEFDGPTNANGGFAGMILIGVEYDGGSAVVIDRGGSVDASWRRTDVEFDDTGVVVVSSDETVLLVEDELSPADGALYVLEGDPSLYVSDGALPLTDDPEVDALDIRGGATLTLALNFDSLTVAFVEFEGDVRNDGTITVPDGLGPERGAITLHADRYFGSGDILTNGTLPGQSGGDIEVRVGTAGFGGGDWLAYGADGEGTNGGNGGSIAYQVLAGVASGPIEHVGSFVSRGGAGVQAGDEGGEGGSVDLVAYLSIWCDCDIDASGGEGDEGADGGEATVVALYKGEVRWKGDISTAGGDGRDDDAGDANDIHVDANGGGVRVRGSLIASGGSVTGDADAAGDGGDIQILSMRNNPDFENTMVEIGAGDVLVAGSILTKGGEALGEGSRAGSGGDIVVRVVNGLTRGDQRLELHGVDGVRARGGDGFDSAGNSNDILVSVSLNEPTTTGSIDIEPPLDTSGGSVLSVPPLNDGSPGGDITLVAPTITRGELIVAGGTGADTAVDGSINENSGMAP